MCAARLDRKAMCGNGIIEEGEECDAGFLDTGIADMCCDMDKCTLKPGAVCR